MIRFTANKLSFVYITLIFLSVLSLWTGMTPVQGQAPYEIRVSQVEPFEQPNGMLLNVYFGFYEGQTSRAVLNAQVESASLTMLNSALTAPATVQVPDAPIYILLLLDSSGSMSSAADSLRSAARMGVQNPPNKAYFGVVQFDEGNQLLQDFTQNMSAIDQAIDRYTVQRRGTCLYDQAYGAVETLEKNQPQGRRAVILFTDGQDEKDDGTLCSKHSYDEVVDLAQKSQIPIHTIGLSESGRLNAVELKNMADQTGGFSVIGTRQTDLADSFNYILRALKNQWLAQATIYPRKGSNQVVLNIKMKDGSTSSTNLLIPSNTDYPGPPSPVMARVDGFNYDRDEEAYALQLSLTSPELVSYIKVSLWDKKSGTKVLEDRFEDVKEANVYKISAEKLASPRDYELHIQAISKENATAFEIQPKANSYGSTSDATEIVREFSHDLSDYEPQINLQSIVQSGNDLVLSIDTIHAEGIAGYTCWLVEEEKGTVAPDSTFTAPQLDPDGRLVMALDQSDVPAGKYKVVIRAMGAKNRVLAQITSDSVVYQPARPNVFQRIGSAVMRSPLIFGTIILIAVLVIGFVFYSIAKERGKLTALPALSGQLDSDKKAVQKGARKLPVNREERVPVIPVQPAPAPVTPTPRRQPASTAVMSRPRGMLHCQRCAAVPEQVGQKFPVSETPFVIGRQEGDLIIPADSVSRRHAVIDYDEQRRCYMIVDLGSKNGTRLTKDGQAQILPAHQSAVLVPGALIELGPDLMFSFEIG